MGQKSMTRGPKLSAAWFGDASAARKYTPTSADQRQVMFHMRLFQAENGMTSPV